MPRSIVAAAAALAVAVAACSPDAPSRALDGTSWVLGSIGGTAVSIPVPPTLAFQTGGLVEGDTLILTGAKELVFARSQAPPSMPPLPPSL